MKSKIHLGVNIDHAATLRQVRGNTTSYPDLLTMTELAREGGASQITIHLREDRRHIQDADVVRLCKKSKLPINLELAVSPEMLKIALSNKPAWVCFVPEKREELTTEGGLDVVRVFEKIKSMTKQLQAAGIKVSFFIEPNQIQVEASARAGANAIEFHTGHWVTEKGDTKKKIWKSLQAEAERAHELGMRVHAGHGLDYEHANKIRKLPFLKEVNIGHSLICYSLEYGLKKSVKKMLAELK
ncbi:pyridoxine 5'-phosphate synthase [Pseudobdellovibrio exovorus]|uniref:Pyridoxine 5'-phosphate synthase n=1 Tax=Pseudobdellovibrio exovorus JSS TaxID=1184267 RepID=M4VAT9_9BACT|nr:pyridoxine 5'-phosphate synthase [Pseudobdellovibrio exovorus]AGH95585.1 pyridoxal phosphate biosynthetic protein PdxJ [Pseudobdellovibrio exovorus JSS]